MTEINEIAKAINELLLRGAESGVNYDYAITALNNRIIEISKLSN